MKKVVSSWDYGYRFVNPIYNGKITKWAKVLLYLHVFGNAKRIEIAKEAWGFDKEHINSNHDIFAALKKEGMIKYNPRTRKWSNTDFGSKHITFIVKNIPTNLILGI